MALVNETKGRMVILDQESPTSEGEGDGFRWSFLCILCVRDWREGGLRSEGYISAVSILSVRQAHIQLFYSLFFILSLYTSLFKTSPFSE